jgi:hypothetical protein
MRPLMDGRVQVDGAALNFLNLPVEETFFRMARYREFEISEMSLSSYCISLSKPERPFIAIPVYPSRFFRHSCIYVNASSGIKTAKDLIGKRYNLKKNGIIDIPDVEIININGKIFKMDDFLQFLGIFFGNGYLLENNIYIINTKIVKLYNRMDLYHNKCNSENIIKCDEFL